MIGRTPNDPQPTVETQPFWDAAREGRFLVKRCRACGKAHWYPRTHCPFCASADTEWTEAGGEGSIYSYSVMRRADPVYVMAYVTLDEGPTMKRWRPRARGRATRIRKRTCHITVEVESIEATKTYPAFAALARSQGKEEIAEAFDEVTRSEVRHMHWVQKALDRLCTAA